MMSNCLQGDSKNAGQFTCPKERKLAQTPSASIENVRRRTSLRKNSLSERDFRCVGLERSICRSQSLDKTAFKHFDIASLRNTRLPGGLSALNYRSLPNCSSRPYKKPKVRKSMVTTNMSTMPVQTCPIQAASGDGCQFDAPGWSCQTNENIIAMESLVLPMVFDPNKKEVRFPCSSISNDEKRALKKIATEHDLVMLIIGKGVSKHIIIRKTARLYRRQIMEKEAHERERLRLAEEEKLRALEEQLIADSRFVTMATQANFDEEKEEKRDTKPVENMEGRKKGKRNSKTNQVSNKTQPMNSAARRRARRQAAALARSRMMNMEIQTCPEDYKVCEWCTMDISPSEQCGHEEVCRAGVKQRQRQAMVQMHLKQYRFAAENARRKKQGLPLLKPDKNMRLKPLFQASGRTRTPSRSPSRQRSRSRNRSVDANLSAALKRQAVISAQLEQVHPNDVDGLVHASQRVCSFAGCSHLIGCSGGLCAHCRLMLCPLHRPAHSGHECKLAPPLPQLHDTPTIDGKVDMACGDDFTERKAELKSRLREKLKELSDKRQR